LKNSIFSSFPYTFSYGELAGSAQNSCWKRCQSCNQGCGEQWSLCCHQTGQAGTFFSTFVIINFLTFFHLLLLRHVPESLDLFSVNFSLDFSSLFLIPFFVSSSFILILWFPSPSFVSSSNSDACSSFLTKSGVSVSFFVSSHYPP